MSAPAPATRPSGAGQLGSSGPDQLGSSGPAQLVVEDVTALLHDAAGEVTFLPRATVVVRDGVVASVEQDVPAGSVPASMRIAGRGQVAMPGLVNCHSHSPMVIFRGMAEDVTSAEWFNDRIWPVEVNLTPRDVELGARLACAEMIASGTTTFADHYFAMDAVADVVEAAGMRANLGWTFFSADGEEGFQRSADFAVRRNGTAGGRITTSLAPHGDYDVDDADLERTARVAAEHDLLVHIHAAESPRADPRLPGEAGMSPIAVLERAGLLQGRLLVAHGRGIVPEDVPALTRAAGRVGVGSSPKGYLKDGSTSTTPIRLLSAAGVPVGLATDGAASHNTLDVWESMQLTALVQKAVERDERWMTARQVLGHATTQSAAAVGLGGVVGSLNPGHRADLVLIDLSGPRTQPVHDLAATLVHSARSWDVTTSVVDGVVLMRDRRLLTLDVADVLAELAERMPALLDVSHGKRMSDYAF